MPPTGKRLPPDAHIAGIERLGALLSAVGTALAYIPAHTNAHRIQAETIDMSEGLFGIHGAALEVRAQRMGVLGSNIANAGTPGYKAL